MSLLVSIVVIVYNSEQFISQCLSSLIGLKFPKENLEIIVVDNNSIDKSKEIILRYPVKYLFEPKIGHAFARNCGLREAKGEYIAFIDSDYIADKSWLENLVSVLENDNSLVAAGGAIKFYSPKTFWQEYTIFSFLSNEERILGKDLLKRALPHLGTANSIFRRDIFDEIGFFDEGFSREEDLDLCLRILLKGYKFKYIPEAIAYRSDYHNFLYAIKKNFINGINIARAIYKYKNIFRYSVTLEVIRVFYYDFLDIKDLYSISIKEKNFRISFLILSMIFCVVQYFGLLIGVLKEKDRIPVLPKSFVGCNKNVAVVRLNIDNKSFSYNSSIVPLIFEDNKEVVFIEPEKDSFYVIKGMALEIWELMLQGRDYSGIIEVISSVYGISKEIVQSDIRDLFNEFKERGILIETSTKQTNQNGRIIQYPL